MIANYNTISKDGKIDKFRCNSCFGSIHNYMFQQDKVRIFILEDYSTISDLDSMYEGDDVFSLKEKKRYCSLLRRMGILVSDPHKTIVDMEYIDEYGDRAGGLDSEKVKGTYIDLYACDMPSPWAIMGLYAIRYLYEDSFPKIVKKFLEWENDKSTSIFNKFILAHYVEGDWDNTNHTFVGCDTTINKLLTPEEINRYMAPTDFHKSLFYLLPKIHVGSYEKKEELIRKVNTSLKEALGMYNTFEEKNGKVVFDDGF